MNAAPAALAASAPAPTAPVIDDGGSDVTDDVWTTVTIASRRHLTDWVDEFRFESPDGSPLPAWTPGSHIDVQIPECAISGKRCWGDDSEAAPENVDSLIRQYSLCSDPADLSGYTIAVDRTSIDRGGRGGSERIHQTFDPGVPVRIGQPRNHFALQRALNYVFIAGGIGITPILPLIAQAERTGRPWTLLCLSRSEDEMPYFDYLQDTWGDRVRIHASGDYGRIDFVTALADQPRGTAVYVCGPGAMAMSVRMAVDPQPAVDVFTEQFSAPVRPTGEGDTPFEVTIASTGDTVAVPGDQSVLDSLEKRGMLLASSCREGMCGTCEVGVVSGEIEHRDTVLTPEERSENESMMICVSRCSSGRLVLDL